MALWLINDQTSHLFPLNLHLSHLKNYIYKYIYIYIYMYILVFWVERMPQRAKFI